MKMIKILLSTAFINLAFGLASSAFSNGLDLDLLYGSRYVALGGNHVTLTGDAYGPFYNPAAMSYVGQRQLAVDFSPLVFTYDAPIGANNAQRTSDVNIGPLFYLGSTHPYSNGLTFGWALYPTALQGGKFSNVDYGNTISGKEYGNKLVRIEFAPSVSYKVSDYFSFGGSWRWAYTQYDKKVGLFSHPTYGSMMLDSSLSTYDAKGLKFGVLLHELDGLSMAITYRPGFGLDLEGDTNATYNGVLSGSATQNDTLSTEQTIQVPAQLQVGIQYEWIPKRFMTIFTYEFTQNSSLDSDAPVLTGGTKAWSSGATNLLGNASTATPLNYKDGHSFHFGAEYTFYLGQGHKVRTGAGYVYDKAVTSRSAPNPALAPPNAYNGYATGVQYDTGGQVIGLAVNYGQYSSKVGAAELDAALAHKAFEGKYGLKVFFATLDYQYRF